MPSRSGPVRHSDVLSGAGLRRLAVPALAVLGVAAGVAGLVAPGMLPMDGLSAVFLLALGLAGTAEGGAAAPLRLGAGLVCVAGPDVALLVTGFELACVLAGRSVFGAVPLLAAAVLVGPSDGFAAVRAGPPGAGLAVAVLGLSFVAAGRGGAGRGPTLPLAGLYVAARFLELCGAGVPAWWGAVLLLAGAGLAGVSAWRAIVAETVGQVGERLFQAGMGAGLGALGVGTVARGSDLPDVAGLAAAGFLCTVLAGAAGFGLFGVAARAVAAGAGTERLARLGGLAGSMPRSSAALGVAAASLAFMPPLAGFGGVWLVCQAGFGVVRSGGGVLVAVLLLGAAGAGGVAGCGAAAVVRLLATACLGRPRLPRSSAAEDPRGVWGWCLPALAGLLFLAGMGVGPMVAGLAGPVRLLSGGPAPAMPDSSPVKVAVLLAVVAVPAAWLSRRARAVAPWNDGRGAPPPWLPFGDPAEQWSAASFAAGFRAPALPVSWRAGLRLGVLGRGRAGWGWQAALFVALLGLAMLAVRR